MSMQTDSRAVINMTPMIDILLVLIIIFMVITPLSPVGLKTHVPQLAPENVGEEVQPAAIVISIAADRSLRINGEAVESAELGGRLLQIFQFRAERVVFVQGHRDLEYRAVAEIVDIARGAGIQRVGLML